VSVPALPEHIDLGARQLRAWRLDDLAAVTEAIDRNRAHLGAFMGWSATASEAQNRDWLQMAVEGWATNRDFLYAITDPDDREIWGSIGLHGRRGPGRMELGYWVGAGHLRSGHATAASGALVALAFTNLPGIRAVEIRCDVSNRASAGVPRRLGFRLDRIVAEPLRAPAETGRFMVWIRERPVPRRR